MPEWALFFCSITYNREFTMCVEAYLKMYTPIGYNKSNNKDGKRTGGKY